ncbi:Cell division cycle 5-like protein [Acorus calamus]|uniref:Cell division cycle 5-like protein n=1 Tax=Acorus calamus TaxID=4465 RepID=A0AAV9CQ41_ACOCL|nr:Cell division cycle 5-like protein [Acorus calamus]
MEEDMSDRIARAKAEEARRQEALLGKRSKVLQMDLPRPPAASLDPIRNSLTKGTEDQSSFVPPTLIEQDDEMIWSFVYFGLHDGADSLITEEVQFLRVAMGHENESLNDFVKARDACQEDLMYFPGHHTYGLASVAGNNEKLAALQNEFDIVKKLDEEAKKAT